MNKLTVALATAFAAACGTFSQTFGRAFTAFADDTPVGSVGGTTVTETPAAAPAKTKAAEKVRAITPAPEPAPTPIAAVAALVDAANEPEVPTGPTTENVREAMLPIIARGSGHQAAMAAILQKYGAKKRAELKPEDYAAVIADFQALEASLAAAD